MTEPFSYEVSIDAPVEQVWRALRDPEEIAQWHGWDDPGLAEEIDVIYFRTTTAFDEDHRIEVDGGDRFTLTDRDGRTVLRLVRAPIGNNPEWDAYYEDINEGWITFLNQLRFAVERHRGDTRRTLYLAADGEAWSTLIGDLQATFASEAPGQPYDVTGPTGERLSGEIWYRSANQVAVTVDGWGDGLLVAARMPTTSSHPDGGGQIIATTYGLAEAAFDRLDVGWRSWLPTPDSA
jgi:hypothetical protein